MTRSEIEAKISKLQKNSMVPQKLKDMQIAKLIKQRDDLDESEKQTESGGVYKFHNGLSIMDLVNIYYGAFEADIQEHMPKNWHSLSEHQQKALYIKQIKYADDLSFEHGDGRPALKILTEQFGPEHGTAQPGTTKTKKGRGRPNTTGKEPKTRFIHKYKGKDSKELTDEECEEAVKESRERRENAAKAEKKSKRRPVMEKVTSNIAKAVKKVIENVPVADIKDAPKTELNKMDRIAAAAKAFLNELKSILGEDFDKSTIADEFKEIHTLIKELRAKYGE